MLFMNEEGKRGLKKRACEEHAQRPMKQKDVEGRGREREEGRKIDGVGGRRLEKAPAASLSRPTSSHHICLHSSPILSPTWAICLAGAVSSLMAEQLAAGCKFLEAQKLVHRDLKARNVLVGDSPGDVVLADLGAARSVLTSREYSSASSVSPARWMAPESMVEAKFSHKSDVWSFGVLLWEITALGAQPWKGVSDSDIYPELQTGNRLPEQQFTP